MELKNISFTALLLFLLVQQSYAFTLNNSAAASFESDEVSIDVASHDCTNIGLTNEQVLNMAEEAANKFWNGVPTSRLTLKKGSIVNVSSDFQIGLACSNAAANTSDCDVNATLKVDSNILISCNTNTTNYNGSPSILGISIPNNISGDKINGALILINDDSSNSFQNKSYDEQVSILAHELGHAIGLGHSQFDSNLMYYSSVATREALGGDDMDGITWLYPTEQPLSGCGTVNFEGPKNRHYHLLFQILMALFLSLAFIKILKQIKFQRFS